MILNYQIRQSEYLKSEQMIISNLKVERMLIYTFKYIALTGHVLVSDVQYLSPALQKIFFEQTWVRNQKTYFYIFFSHEIEMSRFLQAGCQKKHHISIHYCLLCSCGLTEENDSDDNKEKWV